MAPLRTTDEMEAALGERLRDLRLMRNITQATLSARAGVSPSALKNLESGHGATIKTLVRVVRALGRQDWLAGVAPMASVNPLTMVRDAGKRQRARRATNKYSPAATKEGR